MLAVPALFALTLAADFGQPAPAARDDEARIEALVATERAQFQAKVQSAEQEQLEAEEVERERVVEQFPPPPGTRIAFEDVEKMKGRSVRVRTVGGWTRTGEVLGVDSDGLHLRDHREGGYAEFALSRRQIARIEAQ